MTGKTGRGNAGFSIIELLVAIIIIGILVAVLIPIVSNRTEQARIARARTDLENLSEAMARVAIDTGYYVRVFALNAVLEGDGIPFGATGDRYNGLTDYISTVGAPFLQFPDQNSLFIEPRTGEFALVNRDELILRMIRNESAFDGSIFWGGPYITWQRDTDNFGFDLPSGRDGLPDDPWGNNYILFTRRGMVVEPEGRIATSVSRTATGGFASGGPLGTEIFDRPTLLSLGPNGLPGAGDTAPTNGAPDDPFGGDFGDGDDLYRQFGY